jgi:hypothetical protein
VCLELFNGLSIINAYFNLIGLNKGGDLGVSGSLG